MSRSADITASSRALLTRSNMIKMAMADRNLDMADRELEEGDKMSEEIEHQKPGNKGTKLDMNTYTNKKSAAQSMLDVALLMANASQLKTVITAGKSVDFFFPMVALISISILLQVVSGILLIFIVRHDLNHEDKHDLLDKLEDITCGLVFMIVVVNVLISAFGLEEFKKNV